MKENMRWEITKQFAIHPVVDLYKSVGWIGYIDKPLQLLNGIANSSYVVSCWSDHQLIGLARVVSDDYSIMYLQDILVHPDHHRKKIGRGLLNRCLERYAHVRQKVLLTDNRPEQVAFYESLGFVNTRNLKKDVLNAFVQFTGVQLG